MKGQAQTRAEGLPGCFHNAGGHGAKWLLPVLPVVAGIFWGCTQRRAWMEGPGFGRHFLHEGQSSQKQLDTANVTAKQVGGLKASLLVAAGVVCWSLRTCGLIPGNPVTLATYPNQCLGCSCHTGASSLPSVCRRQLIVNSAGSKQTCLRQAGLPWATS